MAVVAAGIVKNRQTSRRSPQRRCISFCPHRPPEWKSFRRIFRFKNFSFRLLLSLRRVL
jgi:hypothetical protein